MVQDFVTVQFPFRLGRFVLFVALTLFEILLTIRPIFYIKLRYNIIIKNMATVNYVVSWKGKFKTTYEKKYQHSTSVGLTQMCKHKYIAFRYLLIIF